MITICVIEYSSTLVRQGNIKSSLITLNVTKPQSLYKTEPVVCIFHQAPTVLLWLSEILDGPRGSVQSAVVRRR